MKLNNQDIDTAIEKVQKFFESIDVPRKDKVKISLLIEEALLRYQEKFGENHDFKLVIRKWFGTPKVLIKIKGTTYNPLEDNDEEQIFSESVMKTLLSYESAGITYKYENGYNEIRAFSTKEKKKLKIPGGSVTISFFLAIIFAFIIKTFSEPTQKIIAEGLVTPILDTLFGAIIAINIPLVFISIVSSICAVENVTVLHELSITILKRLFALMIFIVISTMLVCSIFFPVIDLNFQGQIMSGNSDELQKIFGLILSIVPQNVVYPFEDGEILQIVVMALLTGICVTKLGDRVSEFKNWIMNLQQIIFEMVEIVFKVIPAIIFLSILKTILLYSISEILLVWEIVLAEYILFLFLPLTLLLKNLIKHKVNIIDFLKKIYPACLIVFTTSSGSAGMPKNIEICQKELKIPKNLCEFYIPISHALFPAMKLVGFITCTFFAAEFSGEQITIAQLFIIGFLSIQFAIASSSGNGGVVAMLGLLLTQLGFSLDAIGTMMLADIFVVNISGVPTVIIRDCDLLDLSYKQG